MNRSYSKLRHIQEMNKKLDNRLIEEKTSNQLIETFEVKSEKSKLIDILEKQRLLEENLKYHKNINFRYINEQETDPSTEVEDDDEIGDTPESAEDYEFLQSEFPNEWEEFQKIIMNQILNSPEAKEGGDTETLSESQIKSLLVEGRCNLQTRGLAHCIRYSKFGKWWVKKIGKPTKNAIEDFVYKTNKKFKKWMRDVKDIDLDIEFKKRRKKYKPKKSKNNSRKRMKSLEKTWIGKKSSSAIKIGIAKSKWITFGKGKEAASEEFESDSSDIEPSMEPGENNENYINYLKDNDQLMVSKMSKTSRSNWVTLKQDKDKMVFAVAILEEFNNTYPEKKWTKVGVGLQHEEFEREIEAAPPQVKDTPPSVKKFPYQTESFPMDGNDKNLFQNNQYDEAHAENFVTQVKALCAKIQEYMADLDPPEGQPKAALKAAFLESSASRLRNGGIAEKMSFLELAQKRLETGKAIMIRELKAVGVYIDEGKLDTLFTTDATAAKSERNPEGNGDGSSGPNPPVGYGFVPKGNYKMTAICNGTNPAGKYGGQIPNDGKCYIPDAGKMVPRNECGAPKGKYVSNGTPPEYEQYKYVRGWVQIIFNDNVEPDIDPTDPDKDKKDDVPHVTRVESDNYPVYFYAPGKDPFSIALPGIRIKWKKLWAKFKIRRKPKSTYPEPGGKKWGGTECEAFGG